jgi:hypothetical protein
MKAGERTLSQVLHSPDQYVIPVFQRYYSWDNDEWQTLWNDLTELLDPDGLTKRHFLGSVVVVADDHTPGVTPSYQVIDGQQRLITLSLLLCAIRDAAGEDSPEDIATEVRETYLVHKFKKGRERYKVYPRFRDRNDYIDVVDGGRIPASGRIATAYRWFGAQAARLQNDDGNTTALRELLTAVTTRLDFVLITLDRGENPYKIFSSLNWKGLPLAEADLIRNYVFMNLPLDEQDEFDDTYWRPLEDHFQSAGILDGAGLTGFFRDYVMSTAGYIGKYDTYAAFQKHIGPKLADSHELARGLLRHVHYYDMLRGAGAAAGRAEVEAALQRVRDLNTTTTYPLLLALLERREKGEINDAELAHCFDMIASFILRRYVCGESSRAYSRWFPVAAASLGTQPIERLTAFFEGKGWPTDDEFKVKFVTVNLYRSDYTRKVLVALERATPHKEPADLTQAQIEHVMPQTLTGEWVTMLGESHKEMHWKWLDTPGNLTLTGYNPTLSNRPFTEKKQEFAKSNVLMNRYFADFESWTGVEIEQRGKALADIAARIWGKPQSR